MNKEYIHKDTKTDEPLQQELQNYFQAINGTALYYENYVKQIEQELERYKNIVDKIETYLQTKYGEYVDMESDDRFVISLVLDTLRKLKGK